MKKGTNQSQHSALSTQHSRSTQHFPPPRRGTVLLIVVVLLLMLAILGVSYLGSTRVDRLASGQEVANAQIDQITDSVRDIAVSNIVNGLFASNGNGYQYRGASNNSTAPYNNFDIPLYSGNNTGDAWLADRVPVLPTPGAAISAANSPEWPAITAPMISQSVPAATPTNLVFEDPFTGVLYYPHYVAPGVVVNLNLPVFPSFVAKTTVVNGVNVTTNYPALTFAGRGPFVAGDADGDGIADCGLMRLPGSYADGLTYYAGVRIIDNNSAVNVNTAVSNSVDAALPTTPTYSAGASTSWAYGFFPANVGLAEMLSASAVEIPKLLNYQTNYATTATTSTIIRDDTNPLIPVGTTWGSLDDLLMSQLAHRLGNPGLVSNGGANVRCQPLPLSDQAGLAYAGGVLINPRTVSSTTSVSFPNGAPFSALENLMPASVFNNVAPISSGGFYAPNATTQWFNNNFAYPIATTSVVPNPRPLLVTRNPVSNIAPIWDATNFSLPNMAMPPYFSKGRWQASVTYFPNDVVTWQGNVYFCLPPAGTLSSVSQQPDTNTTIWISSLSAQAATLLAFVPGHAYTAGVIVSYTFNTNFVIYGGNAIQIPMTRYYRAVLANTDLTPLNSDWQVLGGVAGRASINTAEFPELFRAFWSAMAGPGNDATATPFGNEASPSNYSGTNVADGIYTGNQFAVPNPPTTAQTVVLQTPADFASLPTVHKQRMFRSSLRDPLTFSPATGLYLPPSQEMILRAAIAAANAVDLRRTGDDNCTGSQVPLLAVLNGSSVNVNAIVYGSKPQPYISEVYCNTDTQTPGGNTVPYVAIKLYNPYSVPINISNWEIAYIDRHPSATLYTSPRITPITAPPAYTFPAVDPANPGTVFQMAPQSYLLIDNFDGTKVISRPTETGLSQTGAPPTAGGNALANTVKYLAVPNLDAAMDNELVILKFRKSGAVGANTPNGPTSSVAGAAYSFSEQYNAAQPNRFLYDMVPVDSFDFTGTAASTTAWHYARGDGNIGAGNWQCTYPGRYDGSRTFQRQQGTQAATWNPKAVPPESDPWDTMSSPPGAPPGSQNFTLGIAVPLPPLPPPAPNATFQNTYAPIQVGQPGWPSIAGATSFPFGAFARNGDIAGIPYFGAYTIMGPAVSNTPPIPVLYEMNSAPMDSAFATSTDTSAAYTATEQVGRFSPGVLDATTYTSATGSVTSNMISDSTAAAALTAPTGSYYVAHPAPSWQGWDVAITAGNGAGQVRNVTASASASLTLDSAVVGTGACTYTLRRPYAWTSRVLDYLTVYSPRDDYLPNVDPTANLGVEPVSNDNSAASSNSPAEDTVGVDGLINVNTAPWRVLAALPLVMGAAAPDPANSAALAQQIVADREQFGPFKTLFDLNRVFDATGTKGFQNAWGTIAGFTGGTTAAEGSMTPGTNVPSQYYELNLQVARLSNLLTTRSDTFTVYIVIEGWQNAGTANAKLALTRRAAYIVDRNSVTPTSRAVRIMDVPNN